jgi:hypothetical protein
MEAGQAGRVIVKPTNVQRTGMACTDLPALPGASRGRGATVGRDFADRQSLAAVLNSGVSLGDIHAIGMGVLAGKVKGEQRAGQQLAPGGAVATGC